MAQLGSLFTLLLRFASSLSSCAFGFHWRRSYRRCGVAQLQWRSPDRELLWIGGATLGSGAIACPSVEGRAGAERSVSASEVAARDRSWDRGAGGLIGGGLSRRRSRRRENRRRGSGSLEDAMARGRMGAAEEAKHAVEQEGYGKRRRGKKGESEKGR